MNLKGKVAVITGSGQGLGKVFALRLLQGGAKVCLSDVNEDIGKTTLKEFTDKFGEDNVHFMRCDVRKEEEMTALYDGAEQFFKGKVGIFCNNAGINHLPGWRMCMDIDIMSVMFGCELAMSRMSTEAGGSGGLIVNTASLAGIVPGFDQASVSYFVAKHGVVALTRTLGVNHTLRKTGVKVQCICPSFADTAIVSSLTSNSQNRIEKEFGLMTPEFVGDCFLKLVKCGENGAAMAVVKDCPPFIVTDYSKQMVQAMALGAVFANKVFGCEVFTTRHQLMMMVAIFVIFNLLLYGILL